VATLSKATAATRDATESIVKCYKKMFPGTNIFVVSHPIPVYWGHISTLEVKEQLHLQTQSDMSLCLAQIIMKFHKIDYLVKLV
jgi:hypothetical protein